MKFPESILRLFPTKHSRNAPRGSLHGGASLKVEKAHFRVHAYGGVRQHSVLRRVLRRFWTAFWGRVLRRVLFSEPVGFTVKRVLRRVLRRGSEKGVSRRCLERPLVEYAPLGVRPTFCCMREKESGEPQRWSKLPPPPLCAPPPWFSEALYDYAPGGHLKKCRSSGQEKSQKSASGWKCWSETGCQGKCRKKCSGSRLLYCLYVGAERGALVSALSSAPPFRTGTFRSTFSALFLAGDSALL